VVASPYRRSGSPPDAPFLSSCSPSCHTPTVVGRIRRRPSSEPRVGSRQTLGSGARRTHLWTMCGPHSHPVKPSWRRPRKKQRWPSMRVPPRRAQPSTGCVPMPLDGCARVGRQSHKRERHPFLFCLGPWPPGWGLSKTASPMRGSSRARHSTLDEAD